jgi:hypothetical protein
MGREQYSLVLVSRDHQGKQGVHPQEVWVIGEGSTQSFPVFVPFGIKLPVAKFPHSSTLRPKKQEKHARFPLALPGVTPSLASYQSHPVVGPRPTPLR